MRDIEVEIKGVSLAAIVEGDSYKQLCIPLNLPLDSSLRNITLQEAVEIADRQVIPMVRYYKVCDYFDCCMYEQVYSSDEIYNDAKFVVDNFNEDAEGYKKAVILIQKREGTYTPTAKEVEKSRVRAIENKWNSKKKIFKAILTERHGFNCMTCSKKLNTSASACAQYDGDMYAQDHTIVIENVIVVCRSCINKEVAKRKRAEKGAS